MMNLKYNESKVQSTSLSFIKKKLFLATIQIIMLL
jgi:hypothetical protein